MYNIIIRLRARHHARELSDAATSSEQVAVIRRHKKQLNNFEESSHPWTLNASLKRVKILQLIKVSLYNVHNKLRWVTLTLACLQALNTGEKKKYFSLVHILSLNLCI